MPPDNDLYESLDLSSYDLALEFRESLFPFEAESKTMEAPTENKDVEEVPTDKLDTHSYSVDEFLEDNEKSRGSPPLQHSVCDDWNRCFVDCMAQNS